MTPTISTQRLILRPIKKATQRQVAWLRDRDITRYSEQRHHEHTLSSQLRYIEIFAGKSHLWGIHVAETDEHIGNISALHDEPNNVTELGIMIGEASVWGKGLGTEAWRGACNWLLSPDLGCVRKLEAGCMASNVAMAKILRNSAFKEEGARANHFIHEGGVISMLLFGRFK